MIHIVGPIVSGRLTKDLEQDLADCYRNTLDLCLENGIRSVAFCCISTGVFHFPNRRAAEIAVKTVTSVTVVHADPVPLCPETRVVGLDRGIRFLAVSFDGEKTCFASGAPVKRKRAHYKELRKELQFRRTRSARKRIRSLGQRENRWMGDVNHCLSKALVAHFDTESGIGITALPVWRCCISR